MQWLKTGPIWRVRLVLTLIVFAVFWRMLEAGFAYDDLIIITGNSTIDDLGGGSIARIFSQNYWYPHLEEGNLYRPVTILSHAIEHALVGERPLLYHLTNILLHLANVLLLLELLLRIKPDKQAAAIIAAGLFSVHPVLSEVVCNVTCRADVLVVTEILLASLLIIGSVKTSVKYSGLLVLTLLALYTKENGIVLPAIVLLCEGIVFAVKKGFPGGVAAAFRSRPALYGGMVAVSIVGWMVRSLALGRAKPSTINIPLELNVLAYEMDHVRMMTAIKNLGMSLWKFIWPEPLTFDYGTAMVSIVKSPLDVWLWASIVVWIGLLVLVWRHRSKNAMAAVGILLTIGMLLPVSNLFFSITSIFNERFLYLPAVGLALFIAAVAGEIQNKRLMLIIVAVLISGMGFRTWLRTDDWQSMDHMIVQTAAASPRSANAMLDLGALRGRQGDQEAQENAFEQAVEAFPSSPRANFALGICYKKSGRIQEAIPHLKAALTYRPTKTSLMAAMNLGFIYTDAGDTDSAIVYFRRAITINPYEARAHYNLALLYKDRDPALHEKHRIAAERLGFKVTQ